MTDWDEVYYQYRSMDDPIKKQQLLDSVGYSDGVHSDDIYETALHLHRQGPKDDRYFRGQHKKEWNLNPSLFRDESIDVDFEIQRLSSAVRYVQSQLQISQEKALAIVQHYSSAPNNFDIRSWMLDVSQIPEVACFFASLKGEDGEIGAVYLFKSYEMERVGSSTPKQLGEVNIISPEGVPRIENQRAAFIDHTHPKLLNGYLPLNWTFEQHNNVVFEYPPMGITKEELLPEDDEYRDLILEWEEEVWPENIPPSKYVTPAHNPVDDVRFDDYLAILKEWLDGMESSYQDFSEKEKECLRDLCRIHAQLNEMTEIDPSLTSEHLLKQTLQSIIAYARARDREIAFADVVDRYRNESGGDVGNREEVKEAIQSVRPEYEFDENRWDRRW